MNNRQTTWVAIATLTAAALGFAGARALANGAPQLSPLTYGGVLTDKDGKPYPTAQEVVLKFYDKVDATAAKCTAPTTQAEAGTGRFSVVLPGECAQAVRDTPDLWSEATVGGGKTVLPRVHVGAVPYALEADSAKVAAGATGGLKSAMDGVAADVAALKKGGGPKVVDGAGVVLGTLIDISDATLQFVTTAGHRVHLAKDAAPWAPIAKVYYTAADCAGTAFRPVVAYKGVWSGPATSDGVGFWLVDVLGPNGIQSQVFKVASVSSFGECTNVIGGGEGIAVLKKTPAEIGLPAKITAPLKIVP